MEIKPILDSQPERDVVVPAGSVSQFSISGFRQVSLLVVDAAIAAVALWVAMLLRFEGQLPAWETKHLGLLILLLVAARVTASVILRLHKWSFRLSGLVDGARIWLAAILGTGLFLLLLFLGQVKGPPRSVVLIELILSGVAMAALRFAPRLTVTYVAEQTRAFSKSSKPVVIVGAGSAGELLQRDLGRSDEHGYSVVGFLDDNPDKLGMIVGGKPVLGLIDDLPRIAKKYEIVEVLIAVPRLEARRIREILSMCADLKLHFKILPVSFAYLNDRVAASMLQELSPDDLLPREVISFSESDGEPRSAGRVVLVTGAAGSIGSEICRQVLVGRVARVVMIDMNENELYLQARRFERDFPEADVTAEVADIRDSGRVRALFDRYRPQDVFHAAAHKHVPLMEWAPGEAVKNNVLGTRHVAEAAHECGAERFVYISTDKAVRPTSVMGASKRVGEKIVRCMARKSKTRFCAVRFGNVLGSSGSVVPLFREQIAAGGPVTVTDPEVRRYFMTISEAVGLVLRAGYGDYGELCVLDMGEQIRILDLARHMITMVGKVPDVDIAIAFTGLRPGEKLFEELLTEEEESTSSVARKIFVATSPPVRKDLEERLAELVDAAYAEDHARVMDLLRQLVPSYTVPAVAAPQEAPVDGRASLA
ncbi:MAG: polysaccharide biosynthesis protein [Acidobacteria bacterium]|nr:polysaccharide biosynthesis protein [Acidobacteriota bacterium]